MKIFNIGDYEVSLKDIVITVLVLWVLIGLLLPSILFEDEAKEGQFGDMFGAVNALFSGFSIVGIIYAIILQQEGLHEQRISIEYQRQDLKNQREDLVNQREELKETRREFQISRVTTIVYNQLDKVLKELEGLTININEGQTSHRYTNRFAIKKMNIEFMPAYERLTNGGLADTSINADIQLMSNNAERLYNFYESINLSYDLIIKTLNNDDISDKDKKEIVSIFRTNLGKEINENIVMSSKIISVSLGQNRRIQYNSENQKLSLLVQLLSNIILLSNKIR